MPSASEKTIRRKSFARTLADRRTSARAVVFCRWRRFAMEWTGRRRRRSAWIARRCATGFIASTFRGRRSSTIRTEGPKRLSEEQLARLRRSLRPARTVRRMALSVAARRSRHVIAERFGVDFHPRYVGKLLKAAAATSAPGRVIRLRTSGSSGVYFPRALKASRRVVGTADQSGSRTKRTS